MRSLLLLFAVLAIATASTVCESGKKALDDTCTEMESTLRTKLNNSDSSVLIPPMKALKELWSAGRKDQDAIAAFGDNDQVKVMLNYSVAFWKGKMNEVVHPYSINPKAYENLVIEFPCPPPDPKNCTQAYKDAVHNITEIVKNGTEELKNKYSAAMKEIKAKNIREMTCSTYYGLQLTRVYNELEEFVKNNGQWAKADCDAGDIEVAMTSLKSEVENSKKEMDDSIASVCKQFKECTKT